MGLRLPKRQKKGQGYAAHIRSPKQEKEAADRLGGRPTRGSGCGNDKGDVSVDGVLRLECKTTEKKSFSLKRETVLKIEQEALEKNQVPAMEVEFIDSKGNKIAHCAVVPLWVLEELVGELSDGKN